MESTEIIPETSSNPEEAKSAEKDEQGCVEVEKSEQTEKNLEDVHISEEKKDDDSKIKEEKGSDDSFKRPLLMFGPRKGGVSNRFKPLNKTEAAKKLEEPTPPVVKKSTIPALQVYADPHISKEKLIPLPYTEPEFGGICNENYNLEILKNGVIVDTIKLNTKSFYVFGRLSNCDIQMNHPSSSRYHAVLQYRSVASDDCPKGFYVYDLSSTHGTFLNKLRIKPKVFAPVKVGHILKIGGSSRWLILQGPPEDSEPESELSVTELKQQRREKERQAEIERLRKEKEEEMAAEKRREEIEKAGINWGMGEDADEETDLTENPFAKTTNEEVYLTDPKKSLRGWYEREGHELNYDVSEKTSGQFLCRVILPIDDARGRPLIAEALVNGKKKEAVVQCAMEACRLLDRQGLLRQSTHEGKQRKKRDWADDDFYDSDEDTFLDRTGAVETKRQRRMAAAGKLEPRTETYDSLLKQLEEIAKEISEAESSLASSNQDEGGSERTNEEQDALDAFMSTLQKVDATQDKLKRRAAKVHLAKLKQEEVKLRKLANLARPASLPELVAPTSQTSKKIGAIVGARPSAKHKTAPKVFTAPSATITSTDIEEVESSDEEEPMETADKPTSPSGDPKSTPLPEPKSIPLLKPTPKPSSPEPEQTTEKTQKVEKKLGPSIPEEFLRQLRGEGEPEGKEEGGLKQRKKRTRPGADQVAKKSELSYEGAGPDYSTWVPPENQSGDGRTKLNDKYGY